MSDGRRNALDTVDAGPAVREADWGGRELGSPYYPPQGDPLRAPWDPEDASPGRRRSIPGSRDHLRKQSALGRFFTTWGWRAYAIPILLVLTVVVIVDMVRNPSVDMPAGEAVEESPVMVDGGRPGIIPATGQLPDGGGFVDAGTGAFRIVLGGTPRIGLPAAPLFTYTVEIEEGVDTIDFGGDEAVARMVDATLGNPQSWTADGAVAFARTDRDAPAFRVSLTSPATVRLHCGYDIELESSCYNPVTERVYINLARWVRGALSFEGDIGSYRQYVVNHEVGHAIGHPQHDACPQDGALAPIMMQQTFGVTNRDIFLLDPAGVVPDNGDTCRYNPWPFPGGLVVAR